MIARVWLGAAIGLCIGCRSRPAEAGPQTCPATTSSLPADVSADGLAGQYRLQLVASSGTHAGSTAEGELRLLPNESVSRRRPLSSELDTINSYPLYGSTEVDLDAVGAVAGDLGSEDPTQPGVLVILTPPRSDTTGARMILRFGAEANREDVVRFDGSYTVLRVSEIASQGFAGNWESGAPLPRAGGHFCAVREGGKDGKD